MNRVSMMPCSSRRTWLLTYCQIRRRDESTFCSHETDESQYIEEWFCNLADDVGALMNSHISPSKLQWDLPNENGHQPPIAKLSVSQDSGDTGQVADKVKAMPKLGVMRDVSSKSDRVRNGSRNEKSQKQESAYPHPISRDRFDHLLGPGKSFLPILLSSIYYYEIVSRTKTANSTKNYDHLKRQRQPAASPSRNGISRRLSLTATTTTVQRHHITKHATLHKDSAVAATVMRSVIAGGQAVLDASGVSPIASQATQGISQDALRDIDLQKQQITTSVSLEADMGLRVYLSQRVAY